MELNAGAMMKPVHQSQQQITRRAALAASGAGVAALWLPESVHAQHESPSETNLRRILSGMSLADKVGQLLMAYLEPRRWKRRSIVTGADRCWSGEISRVWRYAACAT